MSFIAKHITHHDERLIYIARLHWIYLAKGLFWLILLTAIGSIINWQILMQFDTLPSEMMPFIPFPISTLIDFSFGLIPTSTGVMIFLINLFKFMGTEIALTNKRLIYKTGLFFVQSGEVELSEVMEAKVDNGILGVLLGYGKINIDCRFVGDFELPYISSPYRLLRQMNKLKAAGEEHKAPDPSLPI